MSRIDKLHKMKFKNFYISKETTIKVKKWPTEWGKIFANYKSSWILIDIIQSKKETKYSKELVN